MGRKKFSADNVESMSVPCPGVKGFAARMVIIFKMRDGSFEVFKSERMLGHLAGIGQDRDSESRCSFNNTMYLMKAVMSAPKGKAATQEEFVEFSSVFMKKKHLFDDENERYVFTGMVKEHRKTSFLTRVEFVAGLKDLGVGADRVEMATLLAKELRKESSKVARSIGRIAAVDLFIGNYDRFTVEGALNNPQNLFFKVVKGRLEIVGLDSFYDSGGHANFTLGLGYLHEGKEMNLAALVKESQAQISYANKLTSSLNGELVKALMGCDLARPDQEGWMFSSAHVGWEIIRGMEDGTKSLLSSIKRKEGSNLKPLARGVFQRYEKLLSLRR